MDFCFQLVNPIHQCIAICLQLLSAHQHALFFHLIEHTGYRHLDFIKQLLHPGFFQFLGKHRHSRIAHIRQCSGIFIKFFRSLRICFLERKLFKQLLSRADHAIELLLCNVLRLIIVFERI